MADGPRQLILQMKETDIISAPVSESTHACMTLFTLSPSIEMLSRLSFFFFSKGPAEGQPLNLALTFKLRVKYRHVKNGVGGKVLVTWRERKNTKTFL